MPFGPYTDFNDCVAKNSDKASPAGFCAWLHKQITGKYPSESSKDMPNEAWVLFLQKYTEALDKGKGEKEAYNFAVKEGLEPAGWVQTRQGWDKEISSSMQAAKLRSVMGVKVFASGTFTDSAGVTKDWTNKDLDAMVDAFTAGVPAIVPIKAGHTPDGFNTKIAEALDVPVDIVTGLEGQGQIALGRMSSLERKGDLLVASFERVPDAIASLIESGLYSTVSVEIEDKVGEFGPVITAVALLGAEEPAVDRATLDRTSVFGGPRVGARVFSLRLGEDIPVSKLREEFADIYNRLTDVIKGKKGAPIFRALGMKLKEMFEQLAGQASKHQKDIPEEVLALATSEYQGNVDALINWAGQVGFDACVSSLTGKPGITDPVKVCGWLKGQAHSVNNKEGTQTMKIKDIKAKFQEPGMPPGGAEAANTLVAIATALGLGEDATLEDILAAIQALGQKAGAAPEGEKAAFAKMTTDLKKAQDKIATLEHVATVEKYLKITSNFTAIEGEPEKLASDLADLEEKAGKDTADTVLKAYQKADETGATITEAVGTAKSGAKNVAFEDKVQEFMKADPKLTRGAAVKMAMKAYPDLYREIKWQAQGIK